MFSPTISKYSFAQMPPYWVDGKGLDQRFVWDSSITSDGKRLVPRSIFRPKVNLEDNKKYQNEYIASISRTK